MFPIRSNFFLHVLRATDLGPFVFVVLLAAVVSSSSLAIAEPPTSAVHREQGLPEQRPAQEPSEEEVRELWYRVDIAEAPAGWMMVREIERADRLITESKLHLELRRGGTGQTMVMESRFEETLDHQPISAWSEQRLGTVPAKTTYTFQADGVIVTSAAGERRLDLPEGDWLTPFAASEVVSTRLEALQAGDSADDLVAFEIRSMDPALGLQPITTTWTLVERQAEVVIDGHKRRVTRWRQSPSYAPSVQSLVDLDSKGVQLRSVTPLMGTEMTVKLSSKQALSQLEAVAGTAPELLVPSFVFPDRPIEKPRRLRRAVYRLTVDGDMPDLPQTSVQRSAPDESGTRVWVDLDAGEPAAGMSAAELEMHLQSTDYLRHDDPLIRRLSKKAAGGKELGSDRQRAEALRVFVGNHLTEKNLDSILATASEAAATGAGDCTEHAVLLAAMLRASGIPSRVASGLIYAESFAGHENLFAYHMWTQAWIDGRWVDLDATLPKSTAFDAAHITLGYSALQDGSSALVDLASSGPLIGQVSIRVEDLGYSRVSH